MMRACLSFFLVILLATGCNKKQGSNDKPEKPSVHSVASELKAFYDLASIPEYIDNSFCAQVSSWDSTGKNDDGFSGTYSFLRKNDDGSLVIFDVSGSGAINRIWTPTPNNDTLDFYLDNNSKPAFSISFLDLFSGKVYPFTKPLCGNQLGGYYCYLPIPFEKSCKVVTRGKKIQFHQIQYRLYDDNKKVVTFNPGPDTEVNEAIEKIEELWNKNAKSALDFYQENTSLKSGEFAVGPGKSVRIFESDQGGRILGIEISPAEIFEGPDKNTDIRIVWDDEPVPAVFCPVADFFGYAFGNTSMQSLLLGCSDNKAYCYFPMPFDKSARIELISRDSNRSSKPVNIKVNIWYSNIKRDTKKEGKFRAYWHRNMMEEKGKPHVIADISGKGHYVGTILQAQGLKAGMTLFFEGDDSTAVDGKFRMHGTGSEDYFNGGWYAMLDRWDGKMSLPLHGSLDYSLPFCRTGGYRLFISDKISFEKSLYHSIEHGPVGNAFPSDYTSIGLYYCDNYPEKTATPDNELSHVFIPDTLILYPQLLELTLYGSINIETTWKYGTGGESYRFTPGADSWVRISMRDIPPGRYRMSLDLMTEPDGCEFSLWQRQSQLSDWISCFSKKEERQPGLYVCDLNLDKLKNTITFRFRTTSGRTSMLMNRIILIRKPSE